LIDSYLNLSNLIKNFKENSIYLQNKIPYYDKIGEILGDGIICQFLNKI